MWRLLVFSAQSLLTSEPSQARPDWQSLRAQAPTHDFVILPADAPRPKLFLADMESTIIEQEMLDELALYVGKQAEVQAITAAAMRGELDFKAALLARVQMLAGLPENLLHEVAQKITPSAGAEKLLQGLLAKNIPCWLVSSGFTFFTSIVAQQFGFTEHRGNVLDIQHGKITGLVQEPILDKHAKLAALHEACARYHCRPQEVIAVGDGANDLLMLEAAGYGVAFRAKPKVAEAAPNRLDYADLSALLEIAFFR